MHRVITPGRPHRAEKAIHLAHPHHRQHGLCRPRRRGASARRPAGRRADRLRRRLLRPLPDHAGPAAGDGCSTRSISATSAASRRRLLEGVDAVVHLAAVSNDPMGVRFEAVTDEINHRASVHGRRGGARGGREALRLRLVLQRLRLRGGRRPQGDRPAQPAHRLCALQDRGGGGAEADGPRRHGRHLPALRHRLRHVAAAAPRSRAERLRGGRAGERRGQRPVATARPGGR